MNRDEFIKEANTKRTFFYAIYDRETKKVVESGETPAYLERVLAENWVKTRTYKHGGSEKVCVRVRRAEDGLFDGLTVKDADRITDEYGEDISFSAAVALMDDEIREEIHAEGYDNPQAFYEEYCRRHMDKYGEAFTI